MFGTPYLIYLVLTTLPLLPQGALYRLGTPARGNIQGYLLAFSNDGKFLAEATHPPAVLVWDVAAGKQVYGLSTGQRPIGAVGFNSGGRIVAALRNDSSTGRVVVFDLATNKKVQAFDVEGGQPLAISPDGKWASFCHTAYEGSRSVYFVSLWDVETGKHVRDLARPYLARHARFSRDGNLLTLATYQHGIRAYDVATGKEVAVYRGSPDDQGVVNWPVLSPDGRGALLRSNPARLVTLDKEAAGEAICQHAGSFHQAQFSQDGVMLAAASHDGSIRRWNVTEKTELPPLLDEPAYCTTMAFSHDRKRLAVANGPRTPRVWDLATGRLLQGFDGHLQRIGELIFSPDSRYVASYSEESARIFVWDLASRTIKHILGELSARYSHIRFSPDGSMIAACHGRENSIVVWDADTGKERLRLQHPRWIATFRFLPEKKQLLSAGSDGVLRWFDLTTGKETRQVTGVAVSANRTGGLIQQIQNDSMSGPVHGYADFSPDGKRFASVTLDGGHWMYGNASMWLQGGKYVLRLWDTETGKAVALKELGGRSFPRYSRDGADVLITGTVLQILDPANGNERRRNDKLPDSIRHMELSPDKNWLLSSRHHASKGDTVAHLWSAKTGAALPLPDAGQGLITATAVAPNGEILATGGADGSIVIWDAKRLAKGLASPP